MRRLKKQGFAISTIIYCILILAILIMGLLFSTMSFSKKTTDDFVYSVEKDLNEFSKTYKEIGEQNRVYTTNIKNLNDYYNSLPNGNQIKSYLNEITTISVYDLSIQAESNLVNNYLLNFQKAKFDLSYEENVDNVTGYIIDPNNSGRKMLLIVAKGKIKTPDNCQNMFSFFKGSGIETSHFDTSNTTYMSGMFQNCTGLEGIDLQYFDFTNVTNMDNFLAGCSTITNINGLQNKNLPVLVSGEGMFSGCSSLTSLDINGFNAPSLSNVKHMFQNCTSIGSINLNNIVLNNMENMYGMFNNCENLVSIDVSYFYTNNVTDMHDLFAGCKKLETINGLEAWQLSSKDVILTSMFNNCQKLLKVDLLNFTCTSKYLNYMFCNCRSLEEVNIGNIDYSSTVQIEYMFYNCYKLKTIYLGEYKFDTNVTTKYNNMFNNCNELQVININASDTRNFSSLNIASFLYSRLNECSISPSNVSLSANKL